MNVPVPSAEPRANAGGRDYDFWRAHDGVSLVWSNPHASDEVMIYNALMRPSFHQLLAIAARFGFARLADLWARLRLDIAEKQLPEEVEQLERVAPTVERCLKHMREGMARA